MRVRYRANCKDLWFVTKWEFFRSVHSWTQNYKVISQNSISILLKNYQYLVSGSEIDYSKSSLLDILQVLFTGFTSLVWHTASESTVLGVPDLTWPHLTSKILQSVRSFYYHLITVLWSTAPSPVNNKDFWLLSRPRSNSWTISLRIRLRCVFVCAAFKSSNAQRVSAPDSNQTADTYHNLNCFDHV